jgi:hypothetical protein
MRFPWQPPSGFEAEVAWGLTPAGNWSAVAEVEPHVYRSSDGAELLTAGRADGVWESNGVLYVLDYKTGKWPVDPARINLQVNAAGMALALRSFCKNYVPGIYYARDGIFDWGDRVEVATRDWQVTFEAVAAAALMDDAPRPGLHCEACWSKGKCPSALEKTTP